MKGIKFSLRYAACLLVCMLAVSFTGCGGGARYERTAGEYVDDKIVVSRVAAALANDPEYKFEDVVVSSHQGTVQLSGFVKAGDQKGRAAEIAGRVSGVKNVDNKITVRP